jgi:hypothetical protein
MWQVSGGFHVADFCSLSALAMSINGISIDTLISTATAASPRVMSVPHPVAYALHVQPARACAATSTASVSLTAMTAGVPITASVTVRDSFGNLRAQNSYSPVSNMDNVLAFMFPLPAPPTPASNFLNGFIPSGTTAPCHIPACSDCALRCLASCSRPGSPVCSGCPPQIRSPFLHIITRDRVTNVYSGWQFNATKAGSYKVVPSLAAVGGLFATFYDRDTTAFAYTSAVRSSAPFGLDFSAASGNAVGPLLDAASIRWQGFIQPKHDGLHTLSVVPRVAASQDKVKVGCCCCATASGNADARTSSPNKLNVPQVWIENTVVFNSASIGGTPTATFSFPLANTLYDVFIAYERYDTCARSLLSC